MKYVKLTLIISAILFNTSVLAIGGKREPPQAQSLYEQILDIFNINQ